MPKNSVADWSSTASDNTDVASIGIQGSNLVSNFDGALREIMAQIATFSGIVNTSVDTVAALKALPTARYKSVYLRASGKEGLFTFIADDYSAEVTADTLGGVYLKADDTITTSGAWVRLVIGGLKPEWFGALGDGTTDDAQAVTAVLSLLSTLGGGALVFDAKTYLLNADFTVPSRVSIIGQEGATKITVGTGVSKLFRFLGTAGSTVTFAATASRGDTSLTTATHGLVDGDLAFILSGQSVRAYSDEWTLSADNQEEYYGEFINIKDAPSGTTLTVEGGIFWPTYPLTTSTIRKITPCKDSLISGIEFTLTDDIAAIIEGFWAKNCRVENCRANTITYTGFVVNWRNCYNCTGRNISVYVDVNAPLSDANFFNYNVFQMQGSTLCGFEQSGAENSSTAFDITFATSEWPSIQCFVKDCWTVSCRYSPVTVHPGCYAPVITGNRHTRPRLNGISNRSRNAIISENTIIAANAATSSTYGIALHEGWARDCQVHGNTIEGFDKGIYIYEGSTTLFGYIGASIRNNTIRHVARAVDRTTSLSNANTANTGLVIADNNISYCSDRYVSIDGFTHGVLIENNTAVGTAVRGFYVENCNNTVMRGNKVYDIGGTSIPFWITSTCLNWTAAKNQSFGTGGNPSYPTTTPSAIVWDNNIGSASLYLANDAATSIQLPSNHCTVIVSGFRSAMNGIGYFQLATSSSKLAGDTNFDVATSAPLTGTTGGAGNVGKFSVAIGAGNVLYFQNRSGNADTFGVHIIASSS
jgi:parallel beta-helix repeat protein